MPPLNLYARVRFALCILHTRPRVQRAPGLPCALSLRAHELSKLGRSEPRDREHIFSRHHPRRRVNQYSEAAVIDPISRGVLDTRLRGYDDCMWAALSSVIASAAKQSMAPKKEWIASAFAR